jgi:hypothetical protein
MRQDHQTGKQKAQGIEVVASTVGMAHGGYERDAPGSHELPISSTSTPLASKLFKYYFLFYFILNIFNFHLDKKMKVRRLPQGGSTPTCA